MSSGTGTGLPDLSRYVDLAARVEPLTVYGKVVDITGQIVAATGLKSPVGETCEIEAGGREAAAEVVGFKQGRTLLMCYGDTSGIKPGSRVCESGRGAAVVCSPQLKGRVVSALGEPLDGGEPPGGIPYPLYAHAPQPLRRRRITEHLDLGVRAINGLTTCGKGQRIGLMAGSGVGKSVLLGMIAKYTEASVNVVALIGERGREVREFIEENLGESGLAKSVVVVSTAEEPPLLKIRAAFAATAVAEYFRDRGEDVLLLMDSVTRVAQAQREIGLAVGEPPTMRGYTPSVLALLQKLLERAGTSEGEGSITGIYTVLVEGDDMTDPVVDTTRSILDGHIVLSRELALQNLYPAIDVLQSISRVMPDIASRRHRELAARFISLLSVYKRFEDLINLGAYVRGTNPQADRAVDMIDSMRAYIAQGMDEKCDFASSIEGLERLFGEEVEV